MFIIRTFCGIQLDINQQKSWIKTLWSSRSVEKNSGKDRHDDQQNVMKELGLLQVCAGQEASAETAIRAVHGIFKY